ncbi:hypothetical protein GJ496_000630 [Pomphorhynchus laevis]|nr:hypothetical protein GJ496_000630 [Pomphorhynchus laevis]
MKSLNFGRYHPTILQLLIIYCICAHRTKSAFVFPNQVIPCSQEQYPCGNGINCCAWMECKYNWLCGGLCCILPSDNAQQPIIIN